MTGSRLKTDGFKPSSLSELKAMPLPVWLVSEMLETQEFRVIYGAPKRGLFTLTPKHFGARAAAAPSK